MFRRRNGKLGINIRGKSGLTQQGEVKYFNSITAWRLEKVADNGAQPTYAAPPTAATPATTNENPFADQGDDDLPF